MTLYMFIRRSSALRRRLLHEPEMNEDALTKE